MSFAVETINLTKRYSQLKSYREILLHPFRKKEIIALEKVNLQVHREEVFGILGPNGAGKTTLIKVLCTLILPNEGRAFVNGLDVVSQSKKVRKSIGYVISDERSFYWRLTGRQNLLFFAKLNNLDGISARKRINEILELTDLLQDADKMFKDYSTGMKQKLALARGLLTDPEIIFMDEPTRSLDPVTAQNVRNFINEKLVRKKKSTILIATHNLMEAEEICNRLVILHKAKIKACGELSQIKKLVSPRLHYVFILQRLPESLKRLWERFPGVKLRDSHLTPENNFQIELEIEDKNTVANLIEAAVAQKVGVLSVYPREATLKEIFSWLTSEV